MKIIPARFLRAPKTNYYYVNNPKVACSSIKLSILNDVDRIHDVESYTSAKNLVDNAKFFSVVRDPFSRLVSGYLDKIHRQTNIIPQMARELKIPDLESHIGRKGEKLQSNFLFFVEALAKHERKRKINGHFRPQFMNLDIKNIEYDFIGSLGRYNEVEDYIRSIGFTPRRHSPHKTDKELKELLTGLSEAKKLTKVAFEKDYRFLSKYF